MTDKEIDNLLDALKKQFCTHPQKLSVFEQKGDDFYNQGQYDVAGAIYNLASEIASSDHPVHEKRLDAIEKWLKMEDK